MVWCRLSSAEGPPCDVGDVSDEAILQAATGQFSEQSRFLRFASGSGTMHGLYRRGREIGGYLIGAVSAVCVAGGRRTGRIAAFEVLGAAALPDNLAA